MNESIHKTLRLSAWLMLTGQILYIVVTQFHTGGDANNHPAIFAAYAASGIWTAVHIGQFFAMTILIAGLIALYYALNVENKIVWWVGRFGAVLSVVSLALYGALQAVDGVANKQADNAWVSAVGADKVAHFAGAEAIRWIEWGMRSYNNLVLGLALLLFALAVFKTAWLPRLVGLLIGLTGISYLVQGWVVGTEGFSQTMSIAIVTSWVLSVVWMVWLVIISGSKTSSK